MKGDVYKRVLKEQIALLDKVAKLRVYIDGHDDCSSLLLLQYSVMSVYIGILELRLKELKKNE